MFAINNVKSYVLYIFGCEKMYINLMDLQKHNGNFLINARIQNQVKKTGVKYHHSSLEINLLCSTSNQYEN